MLLQVHSGDVSAGAARLKGIAGVHLAWREALMCGPTPKLDDDEKWVALRAQHLAETYEEDAQRVAEDWRSMLRTLDEHPVDERVILHFDDDLFCQINLMFVVSRLVKRGVREIFLPDAENPLFIDSLWAYQRAWDAYRDPDPQELVKLLRRGGLLPLALGDALSLQLRRFPHVTSGLGILEETVLHLGGRELPFWEFFRVFSKQMPLLGAGDFQVWDVIQRLTRTQPAAMQCSMGKGALKGGRYKDAVVSRTEWGNKVLRGEARLVVEGERWLGGVNLALSTWKRTDEGVLVKSS